jgi:hypothetical protein
MVLSRLGHCIGREKGAIAFHSKKPSTGTMQRRRRGRIGKGQSAASDARRGIDVTTFFVIHGRVPMVACFARPLAEMATGLLYLSRRVQVHHRYAPI